MSGGVLPRIAFLGPVDMAVPEIVSDHLLHVFGEGLSNIGRHAHASRIEAIVAVEGGVAHVLARRRRRWHRRWAICGKWNSQYVDEGRKSRGHLHDQPKGPTGTIVEWRVPLERLVTLGAKSGTRGPLRAAGALELT